MKAKVLPTEQIYVCGIFVEHFNDILPECLENAPYEVPGNIPWGMFREYWIYEYSLGECSLNIECKSIPWMFHEYPTNVRNIFSGGSRNTIVDEAVPDICWVALKIEYFHESLISTWPLQMTV